MLKDIAADVLENQIRKTFARVVLRTTNGLDVTLITTTGDEAKAPSDQRFFCVAINKPKGSSLDVSTSTNNGICAIEYEDYFSIFMERQSYLNIEKRDLNKFTDFCTENDYLLEWKSSAPEENKSAIIVDAYCINQTGKTMDIQKTPQIGCKWAERVLSMSAREIEDAEWEIISSTLQQAKQHMADNGLGQQTWLDGAIGIAKERSRKSCHTSSDPN